MQIPLKTWLVIHICYREIFNAPVCIKDLKYWLGIDKNSIQEFKKALVMLLDEGVVIEKNGFLVRRGKEAFIEHQPEKNRLTLRILEKGIPILNLISRLPFVKFIGVSGSIAAKNPTIDKGGFNDGNIDLDLYIITSNKSLWIFMFLRFFDKLHRIIKGKHFFCINYVTEEGFLKISNKNFFTATEFVNLKPVTNNRFGKDAILAQNSWINDYYPIGKPTFKKSKIHSIIPYVSWIPNIILFVFFHFLKALKNRDLRIITWFAFSYDNGKKHNYRRVSSPHGGYEMIIAKRFSEIFQNNYPSYFERKILSFLFPVFTLNNETYYPKHHIDESVKDFEKNFNKYSV